MSMARRALYVWATLPTVVMAAEGAANGGFDLQQVLWQGGIGAVFAGVAVKMLLVLYQDKEKNTNTHHTELLEVIRAQIAVNKDLIASNLQLITKMQEIHTVVLENRTIFQRHVTKEIQI
jgi:hypothetical protein